MPTELQGKDTSLWVDTTSATDYPTLNQDDTIYDAIVVGGGITGIAAAYLMQQHGLRVVLIEKNRIVQWTTGSTTAKLSSQHYLIYDYLIKHQGAATADVFARANQSGIDEIERLSKELGIACDFIRCSAYVYSQRDDMIDAIKSEVAAAQQLGLPASFETSTDLPFAVRAAVKFTNQAQFHPRKFLLGLAERFVASGGVIYEQTEVVDVAPGEPHTITTKQGSLRATSLVQASGSPFWHNELFDDAMWMKMSYALAITLKGDASYPAGMYITTDNPMRTIRSAPYKSGEVMIFGGESHEYDDQTFNPDLHYRNLIDDVYKKFDVDRVLYRWLAGDYMPYDRMPYIGPYPDYPTIYVATGYRAWGLGWAMSAARGIVDHMLNRPDDWMQPFSLDRLRTPLSKEDKVRDF